MKQSEVCEKCDLNDKHLSAIECALSIPGLDVLLRICDALETTPDSLLLGVKQSDDLPVYNEVSEKLRCLNERQLALTNSFLKWLLEQKDL
ncbi:MAG: helix-turn-helix transcriptional regulator [Clostridia bacterium]|nr:helix-turn-helix transcriptional regulator [Clostridia bacterium]